MARLVVYDACVLYPAPLRDLLMQLAVADLFQARWTDEIHEEWIRSVLSDRPDIRPESLARCRELMDRHVPDLSVIKVLDAPWVEIIDGTVEQPSRFQWDGGEYWRCHNSQHSWKAGSMNGPCWLG